MPHKPSLGVGVRWGALLALLSAGCQETPEPNASASRATAASPSAEAATGTAPASHQNALAPPSASQPALAPAAASAPTDCANIRAALTAQQRKHAKLKQTCTTDADCVLYGGPDCPNDLVRTCPGPIGVKANAELEPLVRAFNAQNCGGYLWSPYHQQAVCDDGVCAAR